MMKRLLLGAAVLFTANGIMAQCMDWVAPTATTGWTDLGSAPCLEQTNTTAAFEVWQSEAYSFPEVVAGAEYTFSHCEGPGAGSWVPEYTIIAPSGAVDNFGAGDGDGCSITWTASESGTYLVVINEAGNCGVEGADNNGYPAITNVAGGPECCLYPEILAVNIECVDEGWNANIEFGDLPDGFTYILSNSETSDEVAVNTAGEAISGPFANGAIPIFTLTANNQECAAELGSLSGDCTNPCLTAADNSTYNFVDDLEMTIPAPDAQGMCETITFEGWEIWAGEEYIFPGLSGGVMYEFNICTGTSASSYAVDFTVMGPTGEVVASTNGSDDCAITFAAETSGDYSVLITQPGFCGTLVQADNGFPGLSCVGTVGINDYVEKNLAVYPNPVKNTLRVNTDINGSAQVVIFDAVGRVVSNKQLNIQGDFTVEVNNFTNGVYTMQITSDKEFATVKFVKN